MIPVRELRICQTHDPAKGSFMVDVRVVPKVRKRGKPVYQAPGDQHPTPVRFVLVND